MECSRCRNEVHSGELYCGVCGMEVRFTFEDLQDSLVHEIQGEKEAHTERQMRNLLVWLAFFVLIAWTLDTETQRGLVGVDASATDDAYCIPVYSTRHDATPRRTFEDDSLDTVGEITELEARRWK